MLTKKIRVSSSLFGLVVLISFIPVIFGWLGISYLVLISITDLIIIVFTIRLLKSKTPEAGRWLMRRICLGALFGLLASLIGKVFG